MSQPEEESTQLIFKIPRHIDELKIESIISQFINKLSKQGRYSIAFGSGGTLDDWKEKDLKNQGGILLLFRIEKKQDRIYKKHSNEFTTKIDKTNNYYQCITPSGGIGCSHKLTDECTHKCHKQMTVEKERQP